MIALILLAAGNSRRFQRNKLLYEIDGKPMFLYTYEKAVLLANKYEDAISNIYVVTRYEEIHSMIQSGTIVVWNDMSESGISHSIHLGIETAGAEDDYLFIVCDMPALSLTSLRKLLDAYLEGEKKLSCLFSKKHYGNPAIFPNVYREKLLGLTGDMGGKRILKEEEGNILLVSVPEDELADIDYPLGMT